MTVWQEVQGSETQHYRDYHGSMVRLRKCGADLYRRENHRISNLVPGSADWEPLLHGCLAVRSLDTNIDPITDRIRSLAAFSPSNWEGRRPRKVA